MAASAARQRPRVTKGDAAGGAEVRLTRPCHGLHLICHTIAAKDVSAATAHRRQTVLTTAGAAATPDRPPAHLSMALDGPGPGAAP